MKAILKKKQKSDSAIIGEFYCGIVDFIETHINDPEEIDRYLHYCVENSANSWVISIALNLALWILTSEWKRKEQRSIKENLSLAKLYYYKNQLSRE